MLFKDHANNNDEDGDGAMNTSNALVWMECHCPNDILPHILAYAGPQIFSSLNQTSKFWHGVMAEESTWRVISEDLYKVRLLCFRIYLFSMSRKLYLREEIQGVLSAQRF